MPGNDTLTLRLSYWLQRLRRALRGKPQDHNQLIQYLRQAEQHNILNAHALEMLEGVLQIADMSARDIMIPRAKMVVIEAGQILADILPAVIKSGYSRFPVMSPDQDEVIGILLAKDLLYYSQPEQSVNFDIQATLRPVACIPASKRLDSLLQEFRRSHNHIAIVVDEYGAVKGLVTIEDILEQIVGDIEDEYDIEEEDFVKQQTQNQFIVKALMPITEFNRYFHTHLDIDHFATLGGFISHRFGYLPQRGDSISLDHLFFKVLRSNNRRILLLQLTYRQK